MTKVKRGQVWELSDLDGSLGFVLVLSGDAYNDLPGGTVLAARVLSERNVPAEAMAVRLTDELVAVLDWVTYAQKSTFAELIHTTGVQELTDVNNLLFKILATS